MVNSLNASTVSSLYQQTSAVSTTSSASTTSSEESSSSVSNTVGYSETAAVYEPSGEVSTSVVTSEVANSEVADEVTSDLVSDEVASDEVASDEVADEVTSEVATSTSSTSSTSSFLDSAIKVASSALTETAKQSKVDLMLQQADLQAQNFAVLVQSTFSKQADKSSISSVSSLSETFSNMSVDAQTVADAQAAISEDGYFGVTQTAERISSFALAIAGDDPDKLADMITAIDKGFAMATQAWGDELPEISQQTYDQVMINLGVSTGE